jgi:hypothetical protein
MMIIKHLRSPGGQPGAMLRIALSWTQAYVGTSKPIWEYPTSPIPHHPAPYIDSIRTFLARIDGSIIMDDPSIMPILLRRRDQYIMDIVMEQGYKSATVKRLNACRRYLQAITLADICDATGSRLLDGVSTGSIDRHRDDMTCEKFNQAKPFPPAWLSWRKFLS